MSWVLFGTGVSMLVVTTVSIALFAYVWLQSHGVAHMTYPRVDKMAGDEGED